VITLRRLDGQLPAGEREEIFASTAAQGERLKRLIEELLLVAATEHTGSSVDAQVVRLAAFADEIRDDAAAIAGKRLTIDVGTPEATVVLDAAKVRRIVLNLVDNAVKYADAGPIDIAAELIGQELAISVRDYGPGIAPESRDRAFERFVQLDQSAARRQGGTGLGLYLCRQLAEVLGGTLTLVDPPGGGCEFVLRVPVRPHDPEAARHDARPVRGVLRRPQAA
jgi:signal transduction histidine kinase